MMCTMCTRTRPPPRTKSVSRRARTRTRTKCTDPTDCNRDGEGDGVGVGVDVCDRSAAFVIDWTPLLKLCSSYRSCSCSSKSKSTSSSRPSSRYTSWMSGAGSAVNATMWMTITITVLTTTFGFVPTSAGFSSTSAGSSVHYYRASHHHPRSQALHLNLTFIDELETSCPSYCSEQLQFNSLCVNQGCKQWKRALPNGCGSVCNGSEGNFRQFYACQVGCSKIVEDYYYHLTGILGVPDPPTLISDSLQSTSLALSWEGSSQAIPYLVYTIQKRLYLRNHPWESIPSEPLNQTNFLVQGLKPYTEYQFRVGWILAQDFPPYYSLESNPIETLPKGLPNKPEITSVQSISNTSVAVTWLAPSQLNGRLVAYILKLQRAQHGHVLIKEIPMSQNPRGYTFSGLLPNTNYSLSISAQNLEGEGSAATINFVTPQSSISNDISKRPEPRLLLQGLHDVYIQQLDILLEPDVSVFISNQNVTAMAAHFKYKWVFVATSDGEIVRTGIERNDSVIMLSEERLDIWVSFLSVDWLHDKLYLVGKKKRSNTWCIKKCEFTGEKLQTVYPNLGAQPIDFMADPYTGYLYWVTPPSYARSGGLYKMDLIGEDHNGVSPPVISVLEGGDFGPFTVDFANYRILIVHKSKNTVYSVSLDGEVVDIRQNTQSPQFGDVLSIGTFNGIFYWTTGHSVVIEEYNPAQDSFYHNSYDVPKTHQPCTRLMILHPDLQPIPIPMAPPQIPQGVFSQRRARVIWRPPTVIAGLGEGSWKDWKYQIIMSDNTSISNISETEYTLSDLTPSTFYSIQVMAYSEAGQSPLSLPFRGRTLRETAYNISLIWGSESGLYSTDTLGENIERLVSPIQWKAPDEDWSITSIAWHESSVFFATTNGSVFYYNQEVNPPSMSTTITVKRLRGISFAQSLAFDYIGEKLYWSNPKKQSIFHCSLSEFGNGSPKIASERLEIVTTAKEIVTDSYKALLVWTTGHTIEMSKLNGYHHSVLHSVGIFSGTIIMGISLDTDQSRIYWINRSSAGATLMRLNYNTRSVQSPAILANLEDAAITGPIRYFSDRLIWLQDPYQAVTTDLNGQGRSSMRISTIGNIASLEVKDQFAQRFPSGSGPNGRGKITVRPNSVSKWSISVSGKWNEFTISWQPVNNTNFGRVFYEVTVNNFIAKPTAQAFLTISNNGSLFKPYSDIEISITALTYWVKAKPTNVTKQSPSAKPSEPLNPRVFIDSNDYPHNGVMAFSTGSGRVESSSYNYNNVISNAPGTGIGGSNFVHGELRWNEPSEPNGKILGYLVHCWKDTVKTSNCFCQVDLNTLSCEFKTLQRSSVYEFAVQAYTDAGAGNFSRRIQCNTQHSNPVPRLLLSSLEKMQIFDIDRNSMESVPSGYLGPTTVTYLASEDTLFWFNEGQDLMKAKLDGSNKTRILSLVNEIEASHLTIDWIARKLYWIAEFSPAASSQGAGTSAGMIDGGWSNEKYRVMSLDLSEMSASMAPMPEIVLRSRAPIKSIAVNPFTSMILWTSSKRTGIQSLYSATLNGEAVEPFLSRDMAHCNCSRIASVGETLAYDPLGLGYMRRGYLIADNENIWLTDESGCTCRQVASLGGYTGSAGPPFSIAADYYHVYWTTANNLYTSEKHSQGVANFGIKPFGFRDVAVLGSVAQPYPDLNCLLPRSLEPREPLLFNHSSHSLHLQMPTPVKTNCSLPQISMAAVQYDVYYGTVDENGITECTPSSLVQCKIMKSAKSLVRISNLHPYTTYTVFVMVTNYYAQQNKIPPLVCSPIMLRTAPGAPMPPKLLRLVPLTPIKVRVVWGRPEKLNGEKVWYEVNWQSENSQLNKQKHGHNWAVSESKTNHNHTEYSFDVTDLHPSSNYSMWVIAFSEKGDSFSESEKLSVETLPNPSNITLTVAKPHELSLVWNPPKDNTILRYQVMYRMGWSTDWNYTQLEEITPTVPGRPATTAPPSYDFTISNLKPKTLYGFRLTTWYVGDPMEPYHWPREGQFNIETLADKPSSPGVPVVRVIGKAMYEVSWEKADENGAVVDVYSLECRRDYSDELEEQEAVDFTYDEQNHYGDIHVDQHRSRRRREMRGDQDQEHHGQLGIAEKMVTSDKPVQKRSQGRFSEWKVVYNGTEPRWQVKNLDIDARYSFRCRASNQYGWGSYSDESPIISMSAISTVVAESQSLGLILGVVALALFILIPFGLAFMYVYRKKHKEKPILINSSSDRREVELATLRELPGGSSFIHQCNILYATGELILDLDLAGVPKLSKHQISLSKLLGSGAFGEVYEGFAANLPNSDGDENGARVAIKTLRKGATNQEKLEFIQEAKLMAQFRHPHILQLVGICIDTDPCCLLLELMDSGDLLSYLRSNRSNADAATYLTLIDLLRICVDVAQGCVYLEEMHFVHRDIAARNCLVRILDANNSNRRIVKIGDFGLARDVYRNDYYRKEGEGLLPVRWMAPESLVDGVFTTQSDVWSFGVLLWEIITFGEQPYPARNNLEVLHFVRTGGRLPQPPGCPHTLNNLMVQCWEYDPENRPSFKDCLIQLEAILQHFEMDEYPVFTYEDAPRSDEYNPYDQTSDINNQSPDADVDPDDSVFLPSDEPGPQPQVQVYRGYMDTGMDVSVQTHGEHHGAAPHIATSYSYPKYLEVISDSNSEHSEQPSTASRSTIRTTSTVLANGNNLENDGYEVPIPRKPARNPKNINSHSGMARRYAAGSNATAETAMNAEIGLPNPNTYWNTNYSRNLNYRYNPDLDDGSVISQPGSMQMQYYKHTPTTAGASSASASLRNLPLFQHNNLGVVNSSRSHSHAHGHALAIPKPSTSSSLSSGSGSTSSPPGPGLSHEIPGVDNTNYHHHRVHNSKSVGTTTTTGSSESETESSSRSHYRNLLTSSTSEDVDEETECLNRGGGGGVAGGLIQIVNKPKPHAHAHAQVALARDNRDYFSHNHNNNSLKDPVVALAAFSRYERPLVRVENPSSSSSNNIELMDTPSYDPSGVSTAVAPYGHSINRRHSSSPDFLTSYNHNHANCSRPCLNAVNCG